MRTYILVTALMVSFCLSAQLSVQNDNYIYVSNRVLYVEDDINLDEADSSLYLRDEGQLIQGAGVTGNSGLGRLSVYQNGNVGSYGYNYWCAPVGVLGGVAGNTPFGITLLNDITGLTTSSPVTTNHSGNYNGTASPLNIEPYWIWKLIASNTYAAWIHVQSASTINPGEGFTMKGTSGTSSNNPGSSQDYDFRGRPNTGTIAVAVGKGLLTLTGNPYPSALDAVAYIHDPDNQLSITGTLYFWEQDESVSSHKLADYDGGYAAFTINSTGTIETYVPAVFYTYNANGTINSSGAGSPSGKQPRRYLPIGQGFMVEGIANSVVRAKNGHRVFQKESGSQSEFFKANADKRNESISASRKVFKVPVGTKRFRLNIDINDTYTRQLVQTFTPEASDSFDYGLEIKLSEPLRNDAYWSLEDFSALLAQAQQFDVSKTIPLAFKINGRTSFRIRLDDVQHFDDGLPIYLHDKLMNTYTDLRQAPFEMTLNTGNNYDERFEVTFDRATLDASKTKIKAFKIWHDAQNAELVILNPNHHAIDKMELFDVLGKRVQFKIVNNKVSKYVLSTNGLQEGIYILSLSSGNRVYNQKIMVRLGA